MVKTIGERIKDVQTNKDAVDFLAKNIELLQSSKEKAASQFRTLMLQQFLLFFAFELLTRAAISEISIGYFKIGDLTLVIKILPTVVSYIYYELSANAFLRKLKASVISDYMKTKLQALYDTDLDLMMFSATTFDAEEIIVRNVGGALSKLIDALGIPLRFVSIFGPLLFIVYAYYRIFATYGLSDIPSWIFLAVSLLFLVQGIFILLQTEKFN